MSETPDIETSGEQREELKLDEFAPGAIIAGTPVL